MFEYTTFKDVFSLLKSASDIRESVNTTILAKKAEVFDKIKTVRESQVVKDYLEGDITGNTAAKKLTAAALAVANKKGYIKLPEKYSNPESIATISDKAWDTIKLGHDVATGKTTADTAADYIVKKGAAMLKTVADKVITPVIEKGKAVVAKTITSAITAVYPPAVALAPVVYTTVNYVGEGVKQFVHKGIDKVAKAATPILKKAITTVKSGWEKLKNWFKRKVSPYNIEDLVIK